MSIETDIRVTIAEAEVTDEYQVDLRVWPDPWRKPRTVTLAPDEAVQLANELIRAATEAMEKWGADQETARSRLVAVPHGFDRDLAPALNETERAKVARFGIHPEDAA